MPQQDFTLPFVNILKNLYTNMRNNIVWKQAEKEHVDYQTDFIYISMTVYIHFEAICLDSKSYFCHF